MPNMLTLTRDRIQQINPQAKVFLYGQELNPQTWAIARYDMLILEPGFTAFKASTLLKDNADIEKCLVVVDRKDLDRITREEFAPPMTINALN